jgi:hypothetical protein
MRNKGSEVLSLKKKKLVRSATVRTWFYPLDYLEPLSKQTIALPDSRARKHTHTYTNPHTYTHIHTHTHIHKHTWCSSIRIDADYFLKKVYVK